MDGTKSFVKTAGDNVITYAEDLSKRSLTVKKGESIVFHQTTATYFRKPIMIAAVSALLVLSLSLKKRKRNNS